MPRRMKISRYTFDRILRVEDDDDEVTWHQRASTYFGQRDSVMPACAKHELNASWPI